MKIATLVTSLVLGMSSVAAAAPHAPAVHANPVAARYTPPMVRPQPQQRPMVRPLPQHTRWTLLDTSKPSRAGRQVIDVNSRRGFTKLKLEATRGVAMIDKVLITFANGRTQVVNVDKRLSGFGYSSFTLIDLNGNGSRQIDKIVILSKSGTRASYSISAA